MSAFEPTRPEGATFHECRTCAGTGYVADEECGDCDGTGEWFE